MQSIDNDLSGLDTAVGVAIQRIRQYCTGKRVLVAFSGGKDSQTCYHLCREAGVPFRAELSLTRFEPPEALAFVREHYPDVTIRRAYKRLLVDEIEYRGLPTRWARWCCNAKHVRTEGVDIAVIGVRAAESPRRRDTWRMFGFKKDRSAYLCPIFDWSDAMVWAYLESRGIPHCKLYDEGFKRVGCVCCPLACTRTRRDEVRWSKTANMLLLGLRKNWAKAVASGGVTRTGKPYRMLGWGTPERAFAYWLRTGSTNYVADGYDPPPYEPCAFEGTGYSEADGRSDDE